MVRELDAMFPATDNKRTPKVPPVPQRVPPEPEPRKLLQPGGAAVGRPETKVSDFFKLFDAPEGEAYRDLEEKPPILAFRMSVKGKVVGVHPRDPEFELPERLYPIQLTAGAGDDAGSSAEDNVKWRDSLESVVNDLELLWPDAERAAESVRSAEERAEARCPKPLMEFRERVLNAMQQSVREEGVTRQQLETYLGTLQSDQRLVRKLYNLEVAVLILEGCGNELKGRMAQAEKFAKSSDDYRRKARQCVSLQERIEGVKYDIWTIICTARELLETEEAMQEFGNFFGSLNPFR